MSMWVNVHSLTCADGLYQFGVVLGSEKRLVVSWVLLQLVLSPTGCHPDQSPVLIGNPLTYITLY